MSELLKMKSHFMKSHRAHRRYGKRQLLATTWLVACLSLAGWFSWKAVSPTPTVAHGASTRTVSATAARTPRCKPIEEIRVGDRVHADNPETAGDAPGEFGEMDPPNWRLLKLQLKKPDGGQLYITLARPVSWLEHVERADDGRVWVEFEELGIVGFAELLWLDACPVPNGGAGRVVTGTFIHSSGDVIDLSIEGLADPIGTTSNHPFWSADRQQFVQAGSLRTGESVKAIDGALAHVLKAKLRESPEMVYNLEVDGEHVYHVSPLGILVHNTRGYAPMYSDNYFSR